MAGIPVVEVSGPQHTALLDAGLEDVGRELRIALGQGGFAPAIPGAFAKQCQLLGFCPLPEDEVRESGAKPKFRLTSYGLAIAVELLGSPRGNPRNRSEADHAASAKPRSQRPVGGDTTTTIATQRRRAANSTHLRLEYPRNRLH